MPDTVIYTPRELISAMKQWPRPTTFLRSLFVRQENKTNKTEIQIDKVFGGQAKATYTSRVGDAAQIGKAGYGSNVYVAPYTYEEVVFTPQDLEVRGVGMTEYDNPLDAVNERIANALQDLEFRCLRTEEAQIAEALQTGVVNITGKDVSYVVDYGQKPVHIKDVSGTTPWSTAGNATANLIEWAQEIADTGAPTPNVLVGDTTAIRAMLDDEKLQKLLDNRRTQIGQINIQQLSEQRASYIGQLALPGVTVDVYTYSGMYMEDNGGVLVTKRYIQPGTVILGSTAADCRMHYGRIDNFKTGSFVGMRFPNMWQDDRGKRVFLTMESSPLFGLHQTDAFIAAKVLP